jgi:hypothetical protein
MTFCGEIGEKSRAEVNVVEISLSTKSNRKNERHGASRRSYIEVSNTGG